MPDASSNGVCVRVVRVSVPPAPLPSETTGVVVRLPPLPTA